MNLPRIAGSTYSGDLIMIGSGGLSIGSDTAISLASDPSTLGDYRLIGGNIGSPVLSNFLPAHRPGRRQTTR